MARVTKVIVAPDLAKGIREESQRSAPAETGGVLLGREQLDGTRLILSIIGAGPSARAARTSFEPDYLWQQAELERKLRQAPDLSYLGDWHSHPGGRVHPSETDRRLLRSVSSEPASLCPEPVMIICGGVLSWSMRAFAFDRRRRVSRVTLVEGSSRGDGNEEAV